MNLKDKIKAKRLERRLRKRWEEDADWRESVKATVRKKVKALEK